MKNREKILKMTVEEFLAKYTEDAELEQMMYYSGCSEKSCPVYQECEGEGCCIIDKWLDEEVSE